MAILTIENEDSMKARQGIAAMLIEHRSDWISGSSFLHLHRLPCNQWFGSLTV